ncbi:hypothetical protein RIF29_08329 [Crotalaria pallida]|uniref:Elongation factor P n=1 Tax=Crotalaria pallida TaxID=3830 RepID=A0AAN9FT80_CROPI
MVLQGVSATLRRRLVNRVIFTALSSSSTPPCFFVPSRGLRVSGSEVRVGNVIEKQGRIYEVMRVDHSHEGRGKATIKVELRDVANGNKAIQRIATNEDIERVHVREKTLMYMCTDPDGTVVLMDPESFDQIEIPAHLFGKNSSYLQDQMKVKLQFYDAKPFSASVPKRVTCTVKEGIAATPRNRKVVLDNGLTVEVPPHIVAGDAIVVNTEDDSYIESRLKMATEECYLMILSTIPFLSHGGAQSQLHSQQVWWCLCHQLLLISSF